MMCTLGTTFTYIHETWRLAKMLNLMGSQINYHRQSVNVLYQSKQLSIQLSQAELQ